LALVELSVMEQRYRAVLEVEAGCPVTEVAERFGVSRQSVHTWIKRYRAGGLAALADRSHRPVSCPQRTDAEVEAVVCEIRRMHPRWGPARLAHELQRRGITPVPSQATIYRILVRHQLIVPGQRRRPRSSYTRWQREAPMQLWQLDIMGGVFLAHGTEVKLVSGIDDHSRFIVIAHLVPRASARAVCRAFAAALARHGAPEEVLTDNGKQFTGRFTRPRPTEVLFEKICRDNGITTRLTKVRSPTTTGKVERWHRTVREEFLAACDPFPTLAHAQAALDAWVEDYNTARPHQSLQNATPASLFHTRTGQAEPEPLPLTLPAQLAPVPASAPAPTPGASTPPAPLTCVEYAVTVPPSGNLGACGRQIWLGPARAGQQLTVWVNRTTLHLFDGDTPLRTHPVSLTERDLARLLARGAKPGRPAPANALPPGGLPTDAAVEVDRTVNHAGCISLGGHQLSVGLPLAGKRVTARIDATLVHIHHAGVLIRTFPQPPASRRPRMAPRSSTRRTTPRPRPPDRPGHPGGLRARHRRGRRIQAPGRPDPPRQDRHHHRRRHPLPRPPRRQRAVHPPPHPHQGGHPPPRLRHIPYEN
jgi:transposase InsO family protein